MGEEVLPPVLWVWPGGIPGEHLETQVLGDGQPLQGAEASDPVAPVRILGVASRVPVATDELADAAGDHDTDCTAFTWPPARS